MNKKQRKLERAAQLRRELGLEDDDGPERGRVLPDSQPGNLPAVPRRPEPRVRGADKPAPRKVGRGSGGKRAPVETGVPRGQASFERPDVLPKPAQPSHAELALADAREAKIGQFVGPDGKIDPKHHPKKHAPGSLKRADTVWYRGERFWIETAPKTWDKSCYVRICNRPVIPDPRLPTPSEMALTEIGLQEKNMKHAKGLVSFHVHPDLLSLAPPPVSTFARPPTQAEADRKERTAKGQKDVGDPVAVKLREAKSLDDVYRIGAEFLEMQVEDLKKRYAHLNPGQQRMNVGNKMRAKWRKEQR